MNFKPVGPTLAETQAANDAAFGDEAKPSAKASSSSGFPKTHASEKLKQIMTAHGASHWAPFGQHGAIIYKKGAEVARIGHLGEHDDDAAHAGGEKINDVGLGGGEGLVDKHGKKFGIGAVVKHPSGQRVKVQSYHPPGAKTPTSFGEYHGKVVGENKWTSGLAHEAEHVSDDAIPEPSQHKTRGGQTVYQHDGEAEYHGEHGIYGGKRPPEK